MELSPTTKKTIIIVAVLLAIVILTCLYFAFVPAWCTIQVVIAFIVGLVGGAAILKLWDKWAKKGTINS